MADPVAEHWPLLALLTDALDAIDGRTVTVEAVPTHPASTDLAHVSEEQGEAMHEWLLKKQRATGSLGLNE